MIRLSPIKLIGADGEMVGVTETHEALRMAEEAGLDLVEIVPDQRPPICKIMDYGKYKYELSKKQKKSQAAKATELKEIRLGRSVKIDPHDVRIRIEQARKFLLAGHKVLVTQRFRGREMQHRELGINHLREVYDSLADIAKVEQEPRWAGRSANILLAPDKPKVEAYKRKHGIGDENKPEADAKEGKAQPAKAQPADADDAKPEEQAPQKPETQARPEPEPKLEQQPADAR